MSRVRRLKAPTYLQKCGFPALVEGGKECINSHAGKGGSNEESIGCFGCYSRRGERFRLCRRPGQRQSPSSSRCDKGLT
jgi:hypothetical protein